MCMHCVLRHEVIQEDMTVFKIMSIDKAERKYITPYQHFPIYAGRNETAGVKNWTDYDMYEYREYFGCFPTEEAAKDSQVWATHFGMAEIIPCIIPAGTEIIHGRYDSRWRYSDKAMAATVACISTPVLIVPEIKEA